MGSAAGKCADWNSDADELTGSGGLLERQTVQPKLLGFVAAKPARRRC
jgi:hypothetical protein